MRAGEKHSSALVKAGLASSSGLVPAPEVLEVYGRGDWNPDMPVWVRVWIDAEGLRPWPGKQK